MTIDIPLGGGFLPKLLIGIATAATLAGSGAIIKSATTNAVQDVRLDRVERIGERMESLDKTLVETKTEVSLLRKELEKRK